jgi:hypothetical protein
MEKRIVFYDNVLDEDNAIYKEWRDSPEQTVRDKAERAKAFVKNQDELVT